MKKLLLLPLFLITLTGCLVKKEYIYITPDDPKDVDFSITEIQTAVRKIVDENEASVFQISAKSSIGSAFIIAKKSNGNNFTYRALTNQHVIGTTSCQSANDRCNVNFGGGDTSTKYTVVGKDASKDLAVIEFTSSKDLKQLELASSSTLNRGQFVIAIGTPLDQNYYNSVTFGIISGLDRVLVTGGIKLIQHDAAINPGNSGGPLFDMTGRVVGVNTAKVCASNDDCDSIEGMNLAVKSNTAYEYYLTLPAL